MPLCLIVVSYMKILVVCLNTSEESRQKAVTTCKPQIVSVSGLFTCLIFTLLIPGLIQLVSDKVQRFCLTWNKYSSSCCKSLFRLLSLLYGKNPTSYVWIEWELIVTTVDLHCIHAFCQFCSKTTKCVGLVFTWVQPGILIAPLSEEKNCSLYYGHSFYCGKKQTCLSTKPLSAWQNRAHLSLKRWAANL